MRAAPNTENTVVTDTRKPWVEDLFAKSIVPTLTDYIKIPNKSAMFDPDWKVGSSRVDLQACKLEYSIVSPK